MSRETCHGCDFHIREKSEAAKPENVLCVDLCAAEPGPLRSRQRQCVPKTDPVDFPPACHNWWVSE